MARTLYEIKYIITKAKEQNENLSSLTSTSKTAHWKLWVDNISYAHLIVEQLFDQHKYEVEEKIKNLKPHSATWYRNKALAFQYGFNLIADTDVFNNNGFSNDDIERSKLIKYAAVVESSEQSRLIVKIAAEDDNGELSPVPEDVLEAFTAYMKEIRDAGVKISIINYLPDILKLEMQIFRNPLVLDANGTNILTGERTVENAILRYMKNLPFNGELVIFDLQEYIKTNVEGVDIPHDILAESKWINAEISDYGDYQTIDVRKIPESGYFKIENFTGISYVV